MSADSTAADRDGSPPLDPPPVNFSGLSNAPGLFSARRSSLDSSVVSINGSSNFEDDYKYIDVGHPAQMLSGLQNLRQKEKFCDITICVEGREIVAHKCVLASFSSYFHAMFGGNLAESQQNKVTLNGIEAAMVELLINYAYTSEITISRQNVQSLLSASNLLEILSVKNACCHYLEQNMDETNCVGIHCFAEVHACEDLQHKSKDYILQNFTSVCQQEEFQGLTQSKLTELLSDDELVVESEETVYESVIRWLEHNVDNRRSEFSRVLECVRLPLMNPYYIHDYVEKNDVIRGCDHCKKLVEEAKNFHLLPDRRTEFFNSRARVRKSTGYTEVIVAVGGEDDKVVLRSVETFDPNTCQWKPLACLPFAISKHGLVSSGGSYLYLAGGEYPDGSASKSVWRYDPCLDTWDEMMSMQVPRSELGLAMLDGYMYAVGGWDGNCRLDSVEQYNLYTNQWCYIANMKMALTSPAVVAVDGCLFVTGGAILEDGDGIDMVQCYSPRTDIWTTKPSMLIPRSGSGACVLDGLIYVIGGWHASTENTSKVECYNPKTDTWTQKCALTERRYRPGVAVVSGKIYVCGGEEGWDRYHDTIECYDPETDTWEIVGELQSSRSWLSCVSIIVRKEIINKDRCSSTHHCTV
ncbi:hypothetical protein FSP39_022975 [Pinctada imbricata]|uniref:BTB domain-containing protein n=1 Tax=Pinctada imbricata TaxID=66713 RepID=A0AA88XU76_PINIB|nr:hypothetical protein FSP39_022975 [Pinctada imbricata]